MRIFRWIAAALIVAYLIFTPPIIRQGLARDPYRDWLTPATPAWRGRIEIWHIAGFKVYQGSVTHYLEERAEAYCQAHAGVHIEIVGMTRGQYEARVARGAFPDAYSFPGGLVYAEQLRAADYAAVEYRGGLGAVPRGGETLAVPWLMSGYFLVCNTQLLAQNRMELPESADTAVLQQALDMGQLEMPAVLAARAGLEGTLAEAGSFEKGRCMLAVLDARALGELRRGGKLLVSALPFGPYSDELQYLGASSRTDAKRAAIVADFAAFLLSDAEQERLSQLGALPVTAASAPVYAEELLSGWLAACPEPLCPEPFLYQRHLAALEDEALAALAGDENAKKSFSERMAVVENGEL
ncbi:MAG: hypothetical protein Q4C13_06510 [Clostridia bacterium]|nr:hypothetical protein [Clostridia bacterium]